MFLSSLHFSVTTSSYSGLNLKPKQVKCLEVSVLPTGYGKSMIFHLLPSLFYDKMKRTAPSPSLRPVVIVVSPLNALIKDQIRRTEEGNLKAAILSVKRKKITGDLQIDFNDGNLDLFLPRSRETLGTRLLVPWVLVPFLVIIGVPSYPGSLFFPSDDNEGKGEKRWVRGWFGQTLDRHMLVLLSVFGVQEPA